MKVPRRRTEALRLVMMGAALGIAVGIWVHLAAKPERQLSDERIYVFIGEGCPHSIAILRQLEGEPGLRDHLVPVLAEPVDDALSARVCGLVADDIRKNAPWMKVLDDAWICRRIDRWSQSTYEAFFFKKPSFSLGRTPIPVEKEKEVLAAQGLVRRGGSARPVQYVDDVYDEGDETPPRPRSRPSSKLGNWRGQTIGY